MAVIDADTHVDETEDTWEYLLPSERQYRPVCEIDDRDGKPYWLVDGNRFLRIPRDFAKTGTTVETRELKDIGARLADMDRLGTEVQVIYPTLFLLAPAQRPEVDLAVRRAYNRWVGEASDKSNGRLRWVCLLPAGDLDAALEEVRWAKEHGAVGVLKKGDPEFGHWPVDPYFFPLYEEAQRLDMPICVHASLGNSRMVELLSQDGDNGNFLKFKLSVIGACHSLITSRIPQRFPKLRFGFVEVSADWVPYVVRELQKRFAWKGWGLSGQVLRDNRIYVACQTDDDIPHILKYSGEDNLIIGTDYGHADTSTDLEAIKELQAREDLDPRVIRKIVDDNPRALYGL